VSKINETREAVRVKLKSIENVVSETLLSGVCEVMEDVDISSAKKKLIASVELSRFLSVVGEIMADKLKDGGDHETKG